MENEVFDFERGNVRLNELTNFFGDAQGLVDPALQETAGPAFCLGNGQRLFNLRDNPRFAEDLRLEAGGNFGEAAKRIHSFNRERELLQEQLETGIAGNQPDNFKPVAGVENHKFVHALDAGEDVFDFVTPGLQFFQPLETKCVAVATDHKQIHILQKFNMAGKAFAQKAGAAAGAPAGADGNRQPLARKAGGHGEVAINPGAVRGGAENSFFAAKLNNPTVESGIVSEGKRDKNALQITFLKGTLRERQAFHALDLLANRRSHHGERGAGLEQLSGFARGNPSAANHQAGASL